LDKFVQKKKVNFFKHNLKTKLSQISLADSTTDRPIFS